MIQYPKTGYPLQLAFYASIIFLLAIVPISFLAPGWIAWENGPVENSQVVVLLVAVIYNLLTARQSKYPQVFYTAAAFLFLLCLRELSYGRVFFPLTPPGVPPEFIDMKDFPFHTEIYIFLGIYMLLLLYAFIKCIPWRKLLTKPWPLCFFLLAVISAVISDGGDHEWLLGGTPGEIMEELAELLMYLSFLHMSIWYKHTLK